MWSPSFLRLYNFEVPLEVVFSRFEPLVSHPMSPGGSGFLEGTCLEDLDESRVAKGSSLKDSNICVPRKRSRPRKIKITLSCGRPRKEKVREVELTHQDDYEGVSTPPNDSVKSSTSWEPEGIMTKVGEL